MNWIDHSTYSQMQGEHIQVTVHRGALGHGYCVTTAPPIVNYTELANVTIEKAKDEAISLVRSKLTAMLKEVMP